MDLLERAEGLILPKTINGYLDLYSLKNAEDLKLPETINGNLDLTSLLSYQKLKLPEIINGSLYLFSLRNAKGLILPKTINGGLFLNSLPLLEFYKIDFFSDVKGFVHTLYGKVKVDELKEYLEEHKIDSVGSKSR